MFIGFVFNSSAQCGTDQIAVQRYLATKDVSSAQISGAASDRPTIIYCFTIVPQSTTAPPKQPKFTICLVAVLAGIAQTVDHASRFLHGDFSDTPRVGLGSHPSLWNLVRNLTFHLSFVSNVRGPSKS
jgi:hypothetical protein